MEFHEKLQRLRRDRGITQEELAADIYVSRTAVSKWESGRGYPSIDSLRDISRYFSVTIDELLSSETLLTIAEKDNKVKLQRIYDLLFSAADLCVLLLIVLPLYPKPIDGYVYGVNLMAYTEVSHTAILVYWIMFITLILIGVVKFLFIKYKQDKDTETISKFSIGLNLLITVFLIISGETYASVLMVIILIIKMMLLLKKAAFCNSIENGLPNRKYR